MSSATPLTLRVLVVDDEPGMRMGVERALRNYIARPPGSETEIAFEVAMAETGEQALDMVGARPPDIILLDHKLPGISGLEVLARLAKTQPDLLTVMITAYASLDTAVSAGQRGAHDFLPKPFTPEELRATVYRTAKHLLLQREARRLALEKQRLRFEFISVLGHELKAPLAAIEQYLAILDDRTAEAGNEQDHHLVQRSLVRLQGMRKLISDLLDLTRVESGRKKREPIELDLADAARAAFETVALEAKTRGIALELLGPDRVALRADRWEIETIMNNLISNAVKYNRDGGRVEVRLEDSAGRVEVTVRDTGIGIAAEDQARLFNEFSRVKNDQTEHILGSGLGLSIVKKLASLNGGEVSVTSEPGVGSAFRVMLAKGAGDPAAKEGGA